jgi:hypothetical protein
MNYGDYEFAYTGELVPRLEESDCKLVEFVLGFDRRIETVVVMQIILTKIVDGYVPNGFDLTLGIRERKLPPHNEVFSCIDYSVISSERFVPQKRKEVLNKVVDAVGLLIDSHKPPYLTFQTYHPDPPPSAMKKYEQARNKIETCGYIKDFERQEWRNGKKGRWYWGYARREDTTEVRTVPDLAETEGASDHRHEGIAVHLARFGAAMGSFWQKTPLVPKIGNRTFGETRGRPGGAVPPEAIIEGSNNAVRSVLANDTAVAPVHEGYVRQFEELERRRQKGVGAD